MSSTTGQDLVPGDPDQIWLLADSYNGMARVCEEIGHNLRTTDDGGWYGRAAEAFHARFEQQPKRFLAMADYFQQAATALDTYAATLAWTQRQAIEVIATGAEDPPAPSRPPGPDLTARQQAELTGVITGAAEPEPVRPDSRALAVSNLHRALAMLDTVGNESAAAITAAAALVPGPQPVLPPDMATPAPPTAPTSPTGVVVLDVVRPAAPGTWFDPSTLREDPQVWTSAIKEIRKRLRWDGLNRLSPRLAQHIFESHYRPTKKVSTGYHHREGGVDHGELRVTKIIEGPDRHGVYVALWRDPRFAPTQTKKSTFFPDSWSRATVLDAVRHAFLDAMRDMDNNYDPARQRFRGVYRGVRIEGSLKGDPDRPLLSDIVTAYPRGVRKRRKRS